MENELVISSKNKSDIASQLNYLEFGGNEELDIVYMTNNSKYLVRGGENADQFFFSNALVQDVSRECQVAINYVLDILFVVYSAYENYRYTAEASNLDYEEKKREALFLVKSADNIREVIATLVKEFGYERVLGYFQDLTDFDIICLFNSQYKEAALEAARYNLSSDCSYIDDDDDFSRKLEI